MAKGMIRPSSAATRRKGDVAGHLNGLDSTMTRMLGYGNAPSSNSRAGKITNTRSAGNSGAFKPKMSTNKNQTMGAFQGYDTNPIQSQTHQPVQNQTTTQDYLNSMMDPNLINKNQPHGNQGHERKASQERQTKSK